MKGKSLITKLRDYFQRETKGGKFLRGGRLSDNRAPSLEQVAARARASGCSSEWARPVNQESAV